VIDSREGKAEKKYFMEELTKRGYTCVIKSLGAGDFLLFGKDEESAILIERKDASDFLGSLEDKKDPSSGINKRGRIWDQIKRMNESPCRKKYILIEGNPFSKRLTAYRKKGFSKNRIWGSMFSIEDNGVHIHKTKNPAETVEWLDFLIKRQGRKKKHYALRVSPPNSMTIEKKKQYILQGFPKVGPKGADLMLDEYNGHLLELLMAVVYKPENVILIKGISRGIVMNMKEALE
jgi:ERCC4-type nuclease